MQRGRLKSLLVLSAAAAAAVFCAKPAAAEDKFWRNPLGGSFHLGLNWSGDVVPGPADSAVFDLGAILPYAVSLSSDVSNDQLRVWNDQLELTATPGITYSLLSTSPLAPSMVVGESLGDVALLRLLDLSIVADGQLVIGAEGSGTVEVLATSSLKGGEAFIGFVETGQITVRGGGSFETTSASLGSIAGAFGFAIVEDAGSSWINSGDLFVGDFGGGDLLISNSGEVESGSVSSGYSGDGVITVERGGLLRSNTFMRVGDTIGSTGLMQLLEGGRARSQSGAIGFAGGAGTVVVDGLASDWTLLDELDVGVASVGTLTIQNQGVVSSGVMAIGTGLGGDGLVTVKDTDSRLEVGGVLSVGLEGQGQLSVENGGLVISGGGVVGDLSADFNVVSVSGSGSNWDMVDAPLTIGADGVGRLEISGGGMVRNGPATIGRGFGGDGTVVLEGAGTTWSSNGLVSVGANGTALMQISSGAQAIGTSATVGGDAIGGGLGSGVVLITGIDSTWDLSGALIVGGGGNGTISLEGGGQLFSGATIIGDGVGSLGVIELSGSGTNWTASGSVVIGSDGSGNVSLIGGAALKGGDVTVGIGASGAVTVRDAGSTWSSDGMVIGEFSAGTLMIENGATVNDTFAVVGRAAGALGEVWVRGTGTTWDHSDTLAVGLSGDGILTVEAGGLVRSLQSRIGGDVTANGTVIVTGALSQWIATEVDIALGGTGTLDISAGGRVNADVVRVASGPGFGLLRVKDPLSRLAVAGELSAGGFGQGMVQVSDGGEVVSQSAVLGRQATGTAAVSGAGSKWIIGGDLGVGQDAAGVLDVTSGGLVEGSRAFVGRGPTGNGTATISGVGSLWNLSDSLYIGGDQAGPQGSGMVNVASGAELRATSLVNVWATGTLNLENGNVAAGLVDLRGGLLGGNGAMTSPVSSSNGRISTAGMIVLWGPLSIAASSQLVKQGTGTLRINGPQNHGPLATLHSVGGSTEINSNAGAPATAGAAASANLIVRISGSSVTLGADQDLANLNVEFANVGSQSFDLATPAMAGAFRSVRVYPADLVAAKAAIYAAMRNANAAGAADPTDGVRDSGIAAHPGSALGIARLLDAHGDPHILIRPTRIGDLNLDGNVTISDFIDLASNFNSTGVTWQEGDLNYDTNVTISDFIDLASNFNTSYSGVVWAISAEEQQALASFAAAQGAAVPEPASGAFVLTIGAAMLASPRRRR